jgi:ABC-2 type transport system ATP-binding protein
MAPSDLPSTPPSMYWSVVVVENALDGRGLVRTFDAGAGVRGVEIVVRAGEIHALVGLNGAGKSTLMRILLGMLRPTSGTVAIEGRDLAHADWAAVGHLVEYPLAYAELTARQNLALGARVHSVPAKRVAPTVEQIIAELNLTHYADRRSGKLSLGNRQRLGLASALQHHPRIIVLDEPTDSLDPAG